MQLGGGSVFDLREATPRAACTWDIGIPDGYQHCHYTRTRIENSAAA